MRTGWNREAAEDRGLFNYRTTPDCIPHLLDQKNIAMLTAHNIFSEAEIHSRAEIMMENYCKTVVIEARTMVDMAKTEIAPAVSAYAARIAETAAVKKSIVPSLACSYETELLEKLSVSTDSIAARAGELESALTELHKITDICAEAATIRDDILDKMENLRYVCDEAEKSLQNPIGHSPHMAICSSV